MTAVGGGDSRMKHLNDINNDADETEAVNLEVSSKQTTILKKVLSKASPVEKDAFAALIEQLLAIRNSSLSIPEKSKRAIELTKQSKTILPLIKSIARELGLTKYKFSDVRNKRPKELTASISNFWKNRSLREKFGITASTLTLIIFGPQGAGIAALGGAIGVPLWIVFGGGAYVAAGVFEDITGRKPDPSIQYIVPLKPDNKPK